MHHALTVCIAICARDKGLCTLQHLTVYTICNCSFHSLNHSPADLVSTYSQGKSCSKARRRQCLVVGKAGGRCIMLKQGCFTYRQEASKMEGRPRAPRIQPGADVELPARRTLLEEQEALFLKRLLHHRRHRQLQTT